MSNERLLLSEKYKAFLKHDAPVEFLEGTTAAGKTTVGLFKFQIQPSSPYTIQIQETIDYELNAIRNRNWYRGDGNELEQLYSSVNEYADKHKFWASKCTPGMEMRKIHTGLPSLIVRILSSIVLSGMNDFEFTVPAQEGIWKEVKVEIPFGEYANLLKPYQKPVQVTLLRE